MDEPVEVTVAVGMLVRGVEAIGGVGEDAREAELVEATALAPGLDQLGERLAFEVLGDDELRAVDLPQIDDVRDVRVAQLGDDARSIERGRGLWPRDDADLDELVDALLTS